MKRITCPFTQRCSGITVHRVSLHSPLHAQGTNRFDPLLKPRPEVNTRGEWCFFPWFLWNFFQTIRICGKFNFLLLQFKYHILLSNKKIGKHWQTKSSKALICHQGTRKLWRWAIVSTSFDDLNLTSAAEWLISGWPSKLVQKFANHWYDIKMMIAKVPFHMTWSWWGLQN